MPLDPADMRNILAAERTFLAWVRTLISIVGFGIVLSRFSTASPAPGRQFKTKTLAAAVVASAVFLLYANYRYYEVILALDAAQAFRSDYYGPAAVSVIVGTLMAGVLLAACPRGSAARPSDEGVHQALLRAEFSPNDECLQLQTEDTPVEGIGVDGVNSRAASATRRRGNIREGSDSSRHGHTSVLSMSPTGVRARQRMRDGSSHTFPSSTRFERSRESSRAASSSAASTGALEDEMMDAADASVVLAMGFAE
jgi:putative membrane protein